MAIRQLALLLLSQTMLLRNYLFFLLALCAASCGYRWGQGSSLAPYETISVPYVEGDWKGDLTTAIVKRLSQSGPLRYCNTGGALILKVRILDYHSEDIGFRYDTNHHDRLISSVIPDETRLTGEVEVTVLEAASRMPVLGPVRLTAYTEFDHDYYSAHHAVNVFSLGQLTDVDEAYDAAEKPLNRRLAQTIVDYLNDNW